MAAGLPLSSLTSSVEAPYIYIQVSSAGIGRTWVAVRHIFASLLGRYHRPVDLWLVPSDVLGWLLTSGEGKKEIEAHLSCNSTSRSTSRRRQVVAIATGCRI